MACYTRTGHHSKDTGERRNGKSIVATFWLHTISRDGDLQLPRSEYVWRSLWT
jgi:hypothetical protein